MALYGIVTDIHGDLESLAAVEEDMSAEGVERIVCLGDMVDRGGRPEEVVRWVRQCADLVIRGNHEEMEGYPDLETRAMLSCESMEWLASLPRVETENGLRFVHGCPPSSDWTYVSKQSDIFLRAAMKHTPEKRSFVGHTHESMLYALKADDSIERSKIDEKPVMLDPRTGYIINVGSVYHRRTYALFDSDEARLRIKNASDHA